MKKLLVKDILKVTEGKLVIGDCEEVLENFSKDTRQIKENDTYVAIKGANFDGNKFWKQALEKGAKAVIVQDIDFSKEDLTKYKNKIIIKTKDVLESLYEIVPVGTTVIIQNSSKSDKQIAADYGIGIY